MSLAWVCEAAGVVNFESENAPVGPQLFDFDLPADQIAQDPAAERGDARLLVLGEPGAEPAWQHSRAREIGRFLPPGALVVVNDSRVVPARVYLQEVDATRRFELLICDPRPGLGSGGMFLAWVRKAKHLRVGARLAMDGFVCRHLGEDPVDPRARRFEIEAGELLPMLERAGEVPLPPYIRRPDGPIRADSERYQTVYAAQPGSVAAPTAGLHWDQGVLAQFDRVAITLHVGPGTFLPISSADVRDHRVGAEQVEISAEVAAKIHAAKLAGRPIVAVGTTTTRALEAVAAMHGQVVGYAGPVDLVITPGHSFRVIDRLITNFHLPRSSLLMLVCCFGGRSRVLAAYREAVAAGYRFYSYGDCMLLGPDTQG